MKTSTVFLVAVLGVLALNIHAEVCVINERSDGDCWRLQREFGCGDGIFIARACAKTCGLPCFSPPCTENVYPDSTCELLEIICGLEDMKKGCAKTCKAACPQ